MFSMSPKSFFRTLKALAIIGNVLAVPLWCCTARAQSEGGIGILFLGDSLTSGYHLPKHLAYPALIGEMASAASLPIAPINAGVSGDTSAGGLRRLDRLLAQPMDILVLALGANDGLRGLDVGAMEGNLRAIIKKARETHPGIKVLLAGMEVPLSMGAPYRDQFRDAFQRIAAEEQVAAFMPFLLESVAAEPRLTLPDRLHPNEEGQRAIAKHMWSILEPVVRRVLEDRAARSKDTQ